MNKCEGGTLISGKTFLTQNYAMHKIDYVFINHEKYNVIKKLKWVTHNTCYWWSEIQVSQMVQPTGFRDLGGKGERDSD